MLKCLAIRKNALCCAALLLCLLLSSCGLRKAFDAYRTALELKQQERGISCQFESRIIFPAGEGTSSLSYSGSLLSDGQEMGNTAIAVQMAVGSNTLNMNLYYTDGWCYVDTMGVKVKQPMKDTPLADIFATDSIELQEEDFISSEPLKSGCLLKAALPKERLFTQAQELLGVLFQQAKIDWENGPQSVSDGELQFYLDEKGNFSKQVARYSVEAIVEGEKMVLSIETTLRFPDPGKDHEVRLPNDLDTYETLDKEKTAQ